MPDRLASPAAARVRHRSRRRDRDRRRQVGVIGHNPQRHARIRAVDGAADVAGINQLSPVQDANGALFLHYRLHLDVTLQIGPGCKTVFARNA